MCIYANRALICPLMSSSPTVDPSNPLECSCPTARRVRSPLFFVHALFRNTVYIYITYSDKSISAAWSLLFRLVVADYDNDWRVCGGGGGGSESAPNRSLRHTAETRAERAACVDYNTLRVCSGSNPRTLLHSPEVWLYNIYNIQS